MPRVIPIHSDYEPDSDEYGYDTPRPVTPLQATHTSQYPFHQPADSTTTIPTTSTVLETRPPRPVLIPETPIASPPIHLRTTHYDPHIYGTDKTTFSTHDDRYDGYDDEKLERNHALTNAQTRHLPPPPRHTPPTPTALSSIPVPTTIPNTRSDHSVSVNPFNGQHAPLSNAPPLVPPSLHADYSSHKSTADEKDAYSAPNTYELAKSHRNAYDTTQSPPPYTQIDIRKDPTTGVPLAPKAPLMPTVQDLKAQNLVLIEEAKLKELTRASWWPSNKQVYYPLFVLVALASIVIMAFVPDFQHNPYLYKINYLPILFGIGLGFGVIAFLLVSAHSLYLICSSNVEKRTKNTGSIIYYIAQAVSIAGMTIFAIIPFIICMSNKGLFNHYAGVVALSCWWVATVVGGIALLWLNIRAVWDGIKLVQRPIKYEVSAPLELATY